MLKAQIIMMRIAFENNYFEGDQSFLVAMEVY
jgi:hypothetical protein